MSVTTSVPVPAFGNTGFIAPSEASILAGTQADLNAAFGVSFNFSTTTGSVTNPTPQGQIAASEAAIIGDSNDQFLFLTSQFDPAYASGRYQDALARIYFIERNSAQPTATQVACTGAATTVIPTNALIVAADGNQYACTAGGTIPSGGTITLPFACTVTGPIACPAQQFTIYSTVGGWDTAISSAAGTIGNVVESRLDFENRRQQSVALNSVGSLPSILGSVLNVPNVLDAYVTDNATNGAVTTGGVTLAANSLYVCVAGGDPQAVANAIWLKKAPGCAYTGNTTETVTDSNSGYSSPAPTYSVTFQTAAQTPIYFSVSIANTNSVPSNALVLIQNSIIAAFAGADGGPRARIGSKIYASRYYAPVAALGAWVQINDIYIGTSASPTGNSVQMQINQVPTIAASQITLTLA